MSERVCQRCGAERPRNRTRYCSEECGKAALREATRRRDDGRIKPCPRCGRTKEPGKRRFCLACREELLPVWAQAEYERSRAKAARISERKRLERESLGLPPKRNKSRFDGNGNATCSSCEQLKPLEQFSSAGGRKWNAQCKPCYSFYSFQRTLRLKYGLTVERYEELLALQDGRCAICLRKPRTRRLAVDHDHGTGVVRGLLCTNCNHRVLGGAREEPSILLRAAQYLEEPPAVTGVRPSDQAYYTDQRMVAAVDEAEEENLRDPSRPPVALIEVDGKTVAVMTGDTFTGLLADYERHTGVPLTILVQDTSDESTDDEEAVY